MSTVQQIPSGIFYGGTPIPEEWPAWLKNISLYAEKICYEGDVHFYAVVRRDFCKEATSFRGFVAYVDGFVLVSEDVLPCDRPYYALHEIIEMEELAGQKGRCLEALQRELRYVPETLYRDYIERRCEFFSRLIEFHRFRPETSAEAKKEMTASDMFLLRIREDLRNGH